MNIQELIDLLSSITDKSLPVHTIDYNGWGYVRHTTGVDIHHDQVVLVGRIDLGDEEEYSGV